MERKSFLFFFLIFSKRNRSFPCKRSWSFYSFICKRRRDEDVLSGMGMVFPVISSSHQSTANWTGKLKKKNQCSLLPKKENRMEAYKHNTYHIVSINIIILILSKLKAFFSLLFMWNMMAVRRIIIS